MNCKIISVYFGNRRTYPHNSENTITILKDFIENEISLNPGVNQLDTILVNHNCGNKEGNAYLDSLDKLKTYSGEIKVIHRPWNKGIGMSYASFNYAFEKFKDKYDYWLFQEDDYKLIHENYYSEGIDILNKNPNLAFLGYDRQWLDSKGFKNIINIFANTVNNFLEEKKLTCMPDRYLNTYNECLDFIEKIYKDYQNYGYKAALDFGTGLTHKKFLNHIYKENESLPYVNISPPYKQYSETETHAFHHDYKSEYEVWWFFNVFLGELKFSNIYIDYGYELDIFPSDTPLIHSYKSNKSR